MNTRPTMFENQNGTLCEVKVWPGAPKGVATTSLERERSVDVNRSIGTDSFHRATPAPFQPQRRACNNPHDRIQPEHLALPVSREDIATCMVSVTEISGMRLHEEPKLCVPEREDFGISLIEDRHYALGNLQFDVTPLDESRRRKQALAAGSVGIGAAYLPSTNTILFNPGISPACELFGDHWPIKSVLLHEMTHVAQAQSYPNIFKMIRELKAKGIVIGNEPRVNLFDSYRAYKKNSALMHELIPLKLLIEGHASWVQKVGAERVFKSSPKLLHRLGYQMYSLGKKFQNLMPSPDVYIAGRNMIFAVEELQKDLEMAPFLNAAGVPVTLDPSLKNHGLVGLLFDNPEIVRCLLPDYMSGWRRSVRERPDVRPLRNFVMSLPGHIPLCKA